MSARLATEQDQERWNQFVSAQPTGSFLQSFEWGELQEKMGLKIWRIVAPQWQALVIKRPLLLGRSWLYVPRGPHFAPPSVATRGRPAGWNELEKRFVEIGEKEGAIFVRIDPAVPDNQQPSFAKATAGGFSFRKSEREVQPRNTLILDLEKSEEELLAAMHQKTRYNIRLAEKKGVQVRFSKNVNDVEHFLRLAREAHGRGKFSYHPDEYYRQMVKILAQGQTLEGVDLELAIAELQGQVLAVNIIVYFGKTATYAHGASSSESREVMAPHLLQWESIRRAKQQWYETYDFFGISPEGASAKHPWAGVTRFKLGFGGRRVDYIGAYDLVLHDGLYHLFNTARRLRGMLRG